MRCACALEIAFVHHHDIGQIKHHDLLQLQPATIIRVHHQYRKIGNSTSTKRHRFLPGADGFDEDVIEIRTGEQREAVVRRGRKSAGLSARGHAAHEHTIILGIDHRGAIAQQRALPNHARVMRQNRDAGPSILIEESQHEFINQRCLPYPARTGETNDFGCSMFDVRCLM